MKFTLFTLLVALAAPLVAADCESELTALATNYESDLKSLVMNPAKAAEICTSATWAGLQEQFKAAGEACLNDQANPAAAAFAPLMEILAEVPCLKIDNNYCWANFGLIVKFPATQLITAHLTGQDLRTVKLEFPVSDEDLVDICGMDDGACFTKTSNAIIRRIGQIPTDSDTAKEAVRMFRAYTADITASCIKETVTDPDGTTHEEWCRVWFEGNNVNPGPFRMGSTMKNTDLPKESLFCMEDGTVHPCAEAIVGTKEGFGVLGFEGKDLADRCCAYGKCDQEKYHVIKADLTLMNLSYEFYEANKEVVMTALRMGSGYAFRRMAFEFQVNEVTQVEGGIRVSLVLKVQETAALEEQKAKLMSMISMLTLEIVNGQLMLPNMEYLRPAKIDVTLPVSVDVTKSSISFEASSEPAGGAGGSGGDEGTEGGEMAGANGLTVSLASLALTGLTGLAAL